MIRRWFEGLKVLYTLETLASFCLLGVLCINIILSGFILQSVMSEKEWIEKRRKEIEGLLLLQSNFSAMMCIVPVYLICKAVYKYKNNGYEKLRSPPLLGEEEEGIEGIESGEVRESMGRA